MTNREVAKAVAKRSAPNKASKVSPVQDDSSVRDVEQIYETLRNAVLTQRLLPGTQLKEQALADTFNVNRSVVRQALARLEMRRLVEHFPNRGVFVATPTADESRDIFAARRAIEGAILDAIMALPVKPDLQPLRELVEREQEAYSHGRLRQALMLSVDFHRALAQLGGNRVLTNFLEELVARTPLLMLSFRGVESPQCALNEHLLILDAIASGNGARARALMEAHISHLEEKLDLERKDASDDLASLLGMDDSKL